MIEKKASGLSGKRGLFAAGLAVLVAFSLPGTAKAGFEWTPPQGRNFMPPLKSSAPPGMAVNIDMDEANSPVLPMSPFTQDLEEPAETMPSMMAAPVSRAPLQQPVFYDDAIGFGSDIPLVLAMQQIVPPDYSYSFDDGVNQGVRISWNGGRPWNEVLEEAVAPFDLNVVIAGKTVWLRHGWAMAPKEKTRISEVFVEQRKPVEPVMAVRADNNNRTNMPDMQPRPVPMPIAVMEQNDDMPAQSYPRRNPVPFMLKHEYQEETGRMDSPVSGGDTASPTPLVLEDRYDAAPSPLSASMPAPVPPAPPALVENGATGQALSAANDANVMDPFEIRFWHAEPGDSLKKILGEWSSSANVQMLWASPRDYKLSKAVRMHGTFPDAVTHVLMAYQQADPRPLGKLHPNLPLGPSVLIVENYTAATQ